MRRPDMRSLAGGAAGITAGILGGIALSSVSAGEYGRRRPAEGRSRPLTFRPCSPLPGEAVTLRYAIVCAAARRRRAVRRVRRGVRCAPGRSGPFRRFALRRGDDSGDGRYFVDVPRRDRGVAATASRTTQCCATRRAARPITVPAGGAAAPQRSLPLRDATEVQARRARVRPHASAGRSRRRGARGEARPARPGSSGSRELGFVGPSAFDVDADGAVDDARPGERTRPALGARTRRGDSAGRERRACGPRRRA